MKISAPGVEPAEHPRKVMEARGDQVADSVDLLPLAIHDQQPGAEQLPALPDTQIRPDDHLHDPRLIFERQGARAEHGFWTLP